MSTLKVKGVDDDQVIEFLSFNFDGEGNAIADFGDGNLELVKKDDVKDILFGIKGSDPKYRRCD